MATSSNNNTSQPQGSKRLQQTQAQVDEVVDIMRVNVDKVLERDEKLTNIDGRVDELQAGAAQFETSAKKLKRKFWWQNMKMWLLLIGLGVVIVIIIIVWSAASKDEERMIHLPTVIIATNTGGGGSAAPTIAPTPAPTVPGR